MPPTWALLSPAGARRRRYRKQHARSRRRTGRTRGSAETRSPRISAGARPRRRARTGESSPDAPDDTVKDSPFGAALPVLSRFVCGHGARFSDGHARPGVLDLRPVGMPLEPRRAPRAAAGGRPALSLSGPRRAGFGASRLVGETRSLRRVSPNVEQIPSAECPIGPGSTRPSSAAGCGEPGTNLGHEVPALVVRGGHAATKRRAGGQYDAPSPRR